MPDRDQVIDQRATHNASDVAEHGHRLSANRSTWIIARGEDRVLLGGVGGGGSGVMWVDDSDRSLADETYADAPFEPDRLDHFGDDGRRYNGHRLAEHALFGPGDHELIPWEVMTDRQQDAALIEVEQTAADPGNSNSTQREAIRRARLEMKRVPADAVARRFTAGTLAITITDLRSAGKPPLDADDFAVRTKYALLREFRILDAERTVTVEFDTCRVDPYTT
jgi:hypothetical protein